MDLTRLRLQGFKSFVDPTELVISPGLTGVVGPNGCGKSNLLEALRWVMGENRPKAMRGGGMEDVIFGGAQSRPARNFAEVTLTLDNAEHTAPAPFTEIEKIDVVRRITRDAGSVYRANGKESRARDIQMLFADASTGAHSPSLVRQGQISELINARPKARRRILEEAAGISGLYQRRHEAELKLNATETNLARVEDVLSQLDQRLVALARQARQAIRYREIATELRKFESLLLYLQWKDAAEAEAEAEQALTAATQITARCESEAGTARRLVEEREGLLPARREEEAIAAAIVQRLAMEHAALSDRETAARKTIADLGGAIEQIDHDRTRESALGSDADETLTQLDWEQEALTKASQGHDEDLERKGIAATTAHKALTEKEAEFDRLSEDTARLAARHQAAEKRKTDATAHLHRLKAEQVTANEALQTVAPEISQAEDILTDTQGAQAKATERLQTATAAIGEAETRRASAQSEEAEARAAHAGADGELRGIRAEARALETLLTRDANDATPLLDQVRAETGFEAALGAALGDDLTAPESVSDEVTGWRVLETGSAPDVLPSGAEPLAAHVTAPNLLARRLAAIGIVEADQGNLLQSGLHPGQRLVSREGDLWRWDGLRVFAGGAPSAAALRLQQQNKLSALLDDERAAERVMTKAEAALTTARETLAETTETEKTARTERRAADEALAAANRDLTRSEAELERLRSRRETLRMALRRREEDTALAEAEAREAVATIDTLDNLDTLRSAVEAARVLVEGARIDMLAARATADETRREGEARVRRMREIETERKTWMSRKTNAQSRIADLDRRLEETRATLREAETVPDAIAVDRDGLSEKRAAAETRRETAADALAKAESAYREAADAARAGDRAASDAREVRARAEAMREAAAARHTDAVERLCEETDQAPDEVLPALGMDAATLPTVDACDIEVARLRRQRDALGAVNLRAEEDAAEIRTERETLGSEKDDLEAAITRLRQGIATLNQEGRERLLKAFEEVNRNFSQLFRHLFGGGEANLVLVESEDPLDAGLEIMCMPPGKKLATLSLLSGGEQTLTAISLIFAVFLANPSPICVLDEVDAPLDDANVTRFCDLLDEMVAQTTTRFLIITHHAITMSRMSRLFGVTMAEQGVSQLVSVDLQAAEALVES